MGDCPMFRRFYVQKVLCSENICLKGSMFRRFYIQKVQCSEGPMFRKYLFKRSYIQKVLCSEGPIFRYIQKVLYLENSLFDVGKNLHLSVSGKLSSCLLPADTLISRICAMSIEPPSSLPNSCRPDNLT